MLASDVVPLNDDKRGTVGGAGATLDDLDDTDEVDDDNGDVGADERGKQNTSGRRGGSTRAASGAR